MNAAEGLASEAEAALRKARKYTDAAGGRLTAAVAGTKRKHLTGSASKPKCPGCGCSMQSVFIGSTLISIRTPYLNSSMQRKRIRQEELSALPSKSLARSRDPSQNSHGNFSARTDPFSYIPALQYDHRIGESNSDSCRKELYDWCREAESSRDRDHDYGKDRDRD